MRSNGGESTGLIVGVVVGELGVVVANVNATVSTYEGLGGAVTGLKGLAQEDVGNTVKSARALYLVDGDGVSAESLRDINTNLLRLSAREVE